MDNTPSTSTAHRELYSKKARRALGELLLKGWRMLEESCPETNEVPLIAAPFLGPQVFDRHGQVHG